MRVAASMCAALQLHVPSRCFACERNLRKFTHLGVLEV